jgi:hypothetical protein
MREFTLREGPYNLPRFGQILCSEFWRLQDVVH